MGGGNKKEKEGNNPLERPRRRLVDNIKNIS
jgi:hypothetical protein